MTLRLVFCCQQNTNMTLCPALATEPSHVMEPGPYCDSGARSLHSALLQRLALLLALLSMSPLVWVLHRLYLSPYFLQDPAPLAEPFFR